MSIHKGVETLVNTFTTGMQQHPQITALTDGGWVVRWESAEQDGSNQGVYQQAYNANGTTRGGEVRVNKHKTNYQGSSDAAALTDGGWVVTWQSDGQDGDGLGVYLQAYNADGSKQGGEKKVNSYTTGHQDGQQITALSDGGWVVTWETEGQDGSGFGVYQQAYHAGGGKQGGETQVNTYETDTQGMPRVTALPDGGWVVTWESAGQDGSLRGVYQQAYNANGTTRGGETHVSTYTDDEQYRHKTIVLDDGGWVVVWTSIGQDSGETGAIGHGVYQQAFNANGTPRGVETLVNTTTTNSQGLVKHVAALADGGWVVTWMDAALDGDLGGIFQQAYNADGTKQGVETQVNTYTTSYQTNVAVAALSDGGWVVTWQSNQQDGSDGGVYQQAYKANGTKHGGEIRVNTHTNGDQALPQITALDDGGWVVTWSSWGPQGDLIDIYQKVFHSFQNMNLVGTGDDETLVGSYGKDTLSGKGGDDILKGKVGVDLLKGGGGKDVLKGGDGKDILKGGNGADKLSGDKDNDKLTGNGGKDKFIFKKFGGKDTITDFENGKDKIDLSAFNFSTKAQALAKFYEIGSASNDKLGFDHKGTTIIVKGIDMGDLNGADIII